MASPAAWRNICWLLGFCTLSLGPPGNVFADSFCSKLRAFYILAIHDRYTREVGEQTEEEHWLCPQGSLHSTAAQGPVVPSSMCSQLSVALGVSYRQGGEGRHKGHTDNVGK